MSTKKSAATKKRTPTPRKVPFSQQLRDPGSKWQTLALVALPAVVYFLRALQYITKAQLFAEDGTVWLSKGITEGVRELFVPTAGFFHVAERLFGTIVAQLPLQWAPLIFATTAWGLFILTAYYLLSKRTKIFTNNYERLFIALALCLIANFREFFFNFSNSIFLMGIISALILVADTPRHKAISILEKVFFLLTCLTLPFAWFLIFIALFRRYKFRIRGMYYIVASVGGSIAQIFCYLTAHAQRSPVTLFSLVSKYTLLEIYNQNIVPALRFARVDIGVVEMSHGYHTALVTLVCLIVFGAVVVTLKDGNWQIRLLIFFLAAMTFASLKSPSITVPTALDAIKGMAVVPGGNRYFVYGVLAVNIVFIKSIKYVILPKAQYAFMAVFITFGLISSIHYGEFVVNKGWSDYTPQYRQGVKDYYAGKQVVVPVNPDPWTMGLFHKK